MTSKIVSLVTRVYQDGAILHTYTRWQISPIVLPPLKGPMYVRLLKPMIPKIAYAVSYDALATRLSALPNILQTAIVNRVETHQNGMTFTSGLYPAILITYILLPSAPIQQALEDVKEVVKALCQ